VWCCGKIAHP